ncbi:L-tyrosine decarboxylase MfnA [Methanobrevibacter ruminantium M1]|uniref:Probable L-tyrosine/L-aspartate decarboxylase n=1 Tax=Methanobrevibacter ruminantium (strain ATCC 35063 / DSM 1093 / JCM 13430 / OCM 146 / M1) TaxID=634498 RepID=D3DZR8_METRM|nr:tyrosine decarboxylase MfnA [Methanobrevibacter ruminantium]ADC47746.1 L-tyrosine decarboxylase MfnA [Methanobrevibacter ruminantium M1]
MNKEPISEEEIFKELDFYQSQDCKYSDGRILGSMCTQAHPIAQKAFIQFLESNLGDPGLFKGTKAIEDKVLKMIGSFLSIENPVGHIVTGGTEANIMAIRAARNIARDEKGISQGEIIVPQSAHFSFKKASDILNLKLREIVLDDSYQLDASFVEDEINENTVAIVGVAGTTELGMIDPIEELSNIALENNIHLHVDAAFGGFSIPFLKEIGYGLPEFDFSLKGVKSITVDPHKMGLAPIPAGGILFRNEEYLDSISVNSPYLTIKHQSTIVGTRMGATSAATFAVMKYLGKDGYARLAKESLDNAIFLAESVKQLGYELVVEPKLNIVAFNHPKLETDDLAQLIEKRDWKVSCSSCPKAIRVILMNHIKREHIVELISDLKDISESI